MSPKGPDESVAENRRYTVKNLEQVRQICKRYIGGQLAPDDWKFGLGEIDAPSLELDSDDPLPSEVMQQNHVWRIQILSTNEYNERIGHLVIYAYGEDEVCLELSSSIDLIQRRIQKIRQDGYLEKPLIRSDKHRQKMRRSSLNNMVVRGDSRDLSNIGGEEVDLVFTSPPYYNARLMYEEYATYQEYLDILREIFTECHRVLHEGRFLVVNISPVIVPRKNRSSSSSRKPIPFDLAHILGEIGFEFVDDVQWVKPLGAAGHRGRRFSEDRNPMQYKCVPRTENVLVYRKKSSLLIDWFIRNHHDPDIVQRSKVKDDYERSNLWKIQPAHDKVHKAVFPLELAQKVIEYYSFEDDVVLDPFAGIGTTGKAAVSLKRRFVMVEMDAEDHGKKEKSSYIEAMKERLEPEWGIKEEEVRFEDWRKPPKV